MAQSTPQAQNTSSASHTPEYECDVCGSNFVETEGVLACEEHYYCNDCAVEVFHRSMANINEFPASCCARSRNGLPPVLFEELLGVEFMDKYKLRLHEYYTPEAIRVYCANAQCSTYKHTKEFDNKRSAPHYRPLQLWYNNLRWLQDRLIH
jgi:hypothetical protein